MCPPSPALPLRQHIHPMLELFYTYPLGTTSNSDVDSTLIQRSLMLIQRRFYHYSFVNMLINRSSAVQLLDTLNSFQACTACISSFKHATNIHILLV